MKLIDLQEERWNRERTRLQEAVVKTTLDLIAHTGANAFIMDVPNTVDLFIAIGPRATIHGLTEEVK